MWLLDTQKFILEEFEVDVKPEYAILSHKWGKEEISFQDIQSQKQQWHRKEGSSKIKDCCAQAYKDGYDYVWIDTCCINKESSAQLSDAINSMYRYYENSNICYAYLSDVVDTDITSIKGSIWFERGWTLQELIAPSNLIIYNYDWIQLGTKMEADVIHLLTDITGVPRNVLLGDPPSVCNAAQRMSWAAQRKTTREEDQAYCLMGIFGVHMAPLYGEGASNAFMRLQDEILRTIADQTLFLWIPSLDERNSGLLATSPRPFSNNPAYYEWLAPHIDNFADITDFYSLFNPKHAGDPELTLDEMCRPDDSQVPWTTSQCSFPALGPHGVQIFLPVECVPESQLLRMAGDRLVALDVTLDATKRHVCIFLQSEAKLYIPKSLPRRLGNMRRLVSIDKRSEYAVSTVSKKVFRREVVFVSQVDVHVANEKSCLFKFSGSPKNTVLLDMFIDDPRLPKNPTPMDTSLPQHLICRGGVLLLGHECESSDYMFFFGSRASNRLGWVSLAQHVYFKGAYKTLESVYKAWDLRSSRYGSNLQGELSCSKHGLSVSILSEPRIKQTENPTFTIRIDEKDLFRDKL